MPVIVNTTVISNFAAVDRLDLLQSLFEILYISDQVFEEIQTGLLEGYTFYQNFYQNVFPLANDGWLHLTALSGTAEFETFGSLLKNLHSGEASSLAIAYHRKLTFLTDDRAARKSGLALGISISGTLGILLSTVENNLASEAEAEKLLQKMMQNGYYSPVSSLDEILKN